MLHSLTLFLLLLSTLVSAQFPFPINPFTCRGTALACAIQIKARLLPPPASRQADCSSYQRVTVTPDPTTITTTVATETVTVTVNPGPADKRGLDLAARATTVTPTALPTYVFGPCTQPGAYGSACACIGIPVTTTTAPTPTSTVSVTETVTTTVTAGPVDTCVGASCGSYVVVDCDTPSGACSCGIDIVGDSVCFEGTDCDYGSCTANSDCAPGFGCFPNTCCSAAPACLPLAPGQCNGPSTLLENTEGLSPARGGGSLG